jgi:hypothetical protein
MKRFNLFLIFALMFLMPLFALAAPGIPHQFYGSVNYSNSNAIVNGELKAKINGVVVATGSIINGQYGYNPNVFFVADPDSNRSGATVAFFVNDIDTEQTTQFLNGGYTALNLIIESSVDDIPPTVIKIGNDSADVTILANASATLVFSESLSFAGKISVQNALTSGADNPITYLWNVDNSILTITGHSTNLTTFVNDVMASVTDIAGNSSTLLLIDSRLNNNQTSPDGAGTATANNTTPEVVISNPTQAANIIISSGTTNPQINVGSFITNGTGVLPAITITSANANNVNVAISASTTITSASSSWNGIIAAPTITTVTLPETSGQTKTLSTAIEIGFTGAKLSFDKAVRILLPNQAGKRAGYVRTGTTFTEITAICAADNQTVNNALPLDGDCKIDVGSDLVIWTKHFTNFATYTQTTNEVGGGGGGAGGGSLIETTSMVIKKEDANNDGKVDKYDFSLMMSNWGKTGTNVCDFNNDGKVDKYDFSLMMSNWTI